MHQTDIFELNRFLELSDYSAFPDNNKKNAFMRDIISVHHPHYNTNIPVRDHALKHPKGFDITYLFEETMGYVGNLGYADNHHYDYEVDFSDAKTSTIGVNARSNPYSYVGQISNVAAASGTYKIGPLRVAIYNPHLDNILFYFFPKKSWTQWVVKSKSKRTSHINFSYHSIKNAIIKFEPFKVNNFVELCEARE